MQFDTSRRSAEKYRVSAVSPDGAHVAVAWGDKRDTRIEVYNTVDGKPQTDWAAPRSGRLQFGPDNRLLLQEVFSNDALNVWDVGSEKVIWNYASKSCRGVFGADPNQLITFSTKDNFRVRNVADGSVSMEFKGGRQPPIALLTNGNGWLAEVSEYGVVTIHDLTDGHILSEFAVHDRAPQFIGFAPGGEQIICAASLPDGRQAVTRWQARYGNRAGSLMGGSGIVRAASIHPLSGELLVAGAESRVWSVADKPPICYFSSYGASSAPIFWAADDQALTNTIYGCTLDRLLPAGRSTLWEYREAGVQRVTVSADQTLAAACYQLRDKSYQFMCLRNPGPDPQVVCSYPVGSDAVCARLSPHGERLAIGFRNRVEVYDTSTGKSPCKLDQPGLKAIWDCAWVADRTELIGLITAGADRGLAGSEERIVLWNAATGKVIRSATHRTPVSYLAMAPDGRQFAEAGADKMVRIRDASTLAVLREFRAHDDPITAMAWHPSKPILITASADMSIRFWDLDTGRRLDEIRLLAPSVSLSLSPSGRYLGSWSKDSNSRIWDLKSVIGPAAATQPAGN